MPTRDRTPVRKLVNADFQTQGTSSGKGCKGLKSPKNLKSPTPKNTSPKNASPVTADIIDKNSGLSSVTSPTKKSKSEVKLTEVNDSMSKSILPFWTKWSGAFVPEKSRFRWSSVFITCWLIAFVAVFFLVDHDVQCNHDNSCTQKHVKKAYRGSIYAGDVDRRFLLCRATCDTRCDITNGKIASLKSNPKCNKDTNGPINHCFPISLHNEIEKQGPVNQATDRKKIGYVYDVYRKNLLRQAQGNEGKDHVFWNRIDEANQIYTDWSERYDQSIYLNYDQFNIFNEQFAIPVIESSTEAAHVLKRFFRHSASLASKESESLSLSNSYRSKLPRGYWSQSENQEHTMHNWKMWADDQVFRPTKALVSKFFTEYLPPDRELYHLFDWGCHENCEYRCAQENNLERVQNKEHIVKYNGHWLSTRTFGMKEFYSTVFSLLNGISGITGMYIYYSLTFGKNSTSKNGLTKLPTSIKYFRVSCFLFFFGIFNAFLQSALYHAKPSPLHLLIDVFSCQFLFCTCAFFVVMLNMVCHGMFDYEEDRRKAHMLIAGTVALLASTEGLHFYLATLKDGSFDVTFAVYFSLCLGITFTLGIFGTFIARKNLRPLLTSFLSFYVVSFFMISLAVMYEVYDFAPMWGSMDSHAVWHASTVPIGFYWIIGFRDVEKLVVEGNLKVIKAD